MKHTLSCACTSRSTGRGRRDVLALLAGLGLGARGAEAQDAARAEPRNFRVILENDKVRVLEYTSRPGLGVCGTGVHSHPDHVTIALTPAKAKVKQDGRTVVHDLKPGDAFWEPAATHTAENVGGSGTRMILVEIKDKAWKPATG